MSIIDYDPPNLDGLRVWLERQTKFNGPAFHHEVAGYMVASIRRGVAQGRDVRGRPFAPLSPVTAAARRGATVRGTDHILVDTNSMMRSLIGLSSATQATVRFGDRKNAQKGFWHNFGTRRMPRRTFMGVRDYAGHDDVEFIEKRIAPKHVGP